MVSATLVYIAPCTIREQKPILPSEFYLEAGSFENPSLLLVGKGINDIYVGEGRGQAGPERSVIRVPVEADVIAAAIVTDWMEAQYGVVLPDAVPGFFWVPGHVTVATIGKQLIEANERQKLWFKNLVKLADDDWNKFRQHKTISDIQRYACNALKLERPWLLDNEIVLALSECPSCFEKVNPKAIVCAHCGLVLDEERHKAMTYARA
jgi:hypothetical protein